jgi:hypothetical protein
MDMKCGTNIKPFGPHSMHTIHIHGCKNTSAAKYAVLLQIRYFSLTYVLQYWNNNLALQVLQFSLESASHLATKLRTTKNTTGGAQGTHGKEKKCIQGFGAKT